nr:hypothetical protein [Ardenticatenales bacterium]
VLIFSFFLLGAVQAIRFGLPWWRILWVIGAAVLAVFTKTTAGLALILIPLVLIIALWVQQGWRWRWLALVTLTGTGALLLAVLDWEDAAYWYREGYKQSQESTTRAAVSEVPLGTYVLRLEITEEDTARGLLNPLSPDEVMQLAGKTVTIGGWVWANRTEQVSGPGLAVSPAGSRELIHLREPITVTQAPVLVMYTVEVPTDTGKLFYSFFANVDEVSEGPLYLYLDGAFLVEGALPEGAQPTLAGNQLMVGGESRPNLIRNPSAEQAWVHVRPWLDRLITHYSRRSPSFTLAALSDFERSVKFLATAVLPWLIYDYFTAFAWGHVRLAGTFWITLTSYFVWLALAGTLWWGITRGRRLPALAPALLFLGFVLVMVWVNALVWPLPYPWAAPPFPSSRYVLPAVLPATLFLVAGWRALWPTKLRAVGVLLFVLAFVVLNILSINTIHNFYEGVANRPQSPQK